MQVWQQGFHVPLLEMLEQSASVAQLRLDGSGLSERGNAKYGLGTRLWSNQTGRLASFACDEWALNSETTSLSLRDKGLSCADALLWPSSEEGGNHAHG